MTQEEKARAYDEALKVLHKYDVANIMFSQDLKEEMFPELKESEDERIKKWLISTLKSLNSSPVQIDGAYEMMLPAIAWLEKRQKPVISYDALKEGIAHFGITQYQIDNWLKKYVDVEKQGEQKPLIEKLPFEMKTPEESLCVDSDTYSKIVDECIYGEQKPVEWHREDEQNLNACLGYIPDEFLRRWLTDAIRAEYDRPAWSEEDDRMYNRIVSFIPQHLTAESYTACITWLKSLRPQSQWKPSFQQMKQLNWVAEQNIDNMLGKELMTLYKDLEKLRGE